MKRVFFYDFPIGSLGIAEEDGSICRVSFQGKDTFSGFPTAETPLIQNAAAQLAEYFAGRRVDFKLPLIMRGTDFQRSVWTALLSIPYGETRSYQDIAVQIGNPKACRAVGMANNRNPVAIIVPCHRVIGRSGGLTGYAGGLSAKQVLLELEARHV